jgi:predicted outer membrane repeat protein
VTINGIIAHDCKAVPEGNSGGQGGVIAVSACYKFILKNGLFYDNTAQQGGAVYLNQMFDSPDVTTKSKYYGAQIYDTVFEYNNASIGGAVYGKQSIMYATGSRFTNNIATSGTGSAINLALDTIIQHSVIETYVEV